MNVRRHLRYKMNTMQKKVESIFFVEGRTQNRAPRTQVARHYLSGDRIYSDRAADFAVRCDELTQGRVIQRLAAMYDELYIDEVQDLAGYDLDLVERLLASGIEIMSSIGWSATAVRSGRCVVSADAADRVGQ